MNRGDLSIRLPCKKYIAQSADFVKLSKEHKALQGGDGEVEELDNNKGQLDNLTSL